MNRTLHPEGWVRPKGYSYGMQAEGPLVFVSGQIGTDETGRFVGDDLVTQTERALRNIAAVLATAGAGTGDIVRMTWYVTDIEEYRGAQRELGAAYRAVMGGHFPPMTLVAVTALVERQARVEIEATAVIARRGGSSR